MQERKRSSPTKKNKRASKAEKGLERKKSKHERIDEAAEQETTPQKANGRVEDDDKDENEEDEEEHDVDQELLKQHLAYRKRITAEYRPLHPHLFHLEQWRFAPSFVKALHATVEGNVEVLTEILTMVGDGVYAFELLDPKFCLEILEEIENFEVWSRDKNLSVPRPNSMNRYGVILDDFGFEPVLQEFVEYAVEPLSRLLYPHIHVPLDPPQKSNHCDNKSEEKIEKGKGKGKEQGK